MNLIQTVIQGLRIHIETKKTSKESLLDLSFIYYLTYPHYLISYFSKVNMSTKIKMLNKQKYLAQCFC